MGEYLDRIAAVAKCPGLAPPVALAGFEVAQHLEQARGTHPAEHMIAQSAHHIGVHDPQAHSVIEHHQHRAGAAAAAGNHTEAQTHYRDAARKIGAQLGHDHPLYHAASAAAEHHRQMFHSQHHLGAPVQHAGYGALQAGSAARQHFEMGRRPQP